KPHGSGPSRRRSLPVAVARFAGRHRPTWPPSLAVPHSDADEAATIEGARGARPPRRLVPDRRGNGYFELGYYPASPRLGVLTAWRRAWDSNPRDRSPDLAIFKTAAIGH